ncbi:DNA mismatch repair protein MLH3 isoform X1 [Cucurbita maxima]|uniref:DNA mismatch repair protein MLH3 isoform X1 n=1 Tax=Cucurbita maxima TaxID=3661 RepID=A0A6J1I5L5_CUCMA|nr:DNA mismatch repair protein MLH3 isoform X1 [Cucurbita maxima]
MGMIKPLPKSVRSSVRAGVILYDATKVVEELVYNSLDAGASKISIFIGIGTSYVKVVDNGSGITRDGLALLGERYATSKFHDLIDMDTKGKTFGFRGEALASISDVSLVEIITKACGRANGYRKVIKGCKCLYLGIDDDMEDVGTTVIVRDLFYNQPVRRKHMQFSPKKVLQAVKKCVVRTSLVHSKVSFKIVDSESESILLYTNPSPSPLSLLRSGFGSEISRSLRELKIGDGDLKLSGYICSPFDTFTIKAVQYVYINRRFICKGQIHKLLNQLASRFVSLSPQTDQVCHSRKRSRFQANPAYILNLDCPGSFYDLTFESSKTFVQFKDWASILTFIEETIQQFWKEKYSSGKSLVHTTPIVGGDQLWKDEDNIISTNSDFREDVILFPPESIRSVKKSRMRSPQASLIDLFSPSAMLTKDDDILSNSLHEKKACENSHTSSSELNDVHQQARMQFGNQAADHFSGLWGTPLAKCSTTAVQNGDRHPWVPDNIFVSEDSFLDRRLAFPKRCDDIVEDNIFSSDLKGQSSEVYIDMINGSAESTPSSYFHEFSYDDNIFTGNKPSLRGCTSGSSFQLESTSILGDKLYIQNDVIKRIQKQGIPDDEVDVLKLDGYIQGSGFYAGDSLHAEFAEENIYSCHLDKHVQKFFSSYQTRNSPDVHVTPNPRLASEWDVDCFSVRDGVERNWRSRDRTPFRDLVDCEDKGCGFDSDIMLRSSKKNYIPSCIDSKLIIDDVLDIREDLSTSLEKSNNFEHSSPVSPNMHSCQKYLSNWRLPGRDWEKAYGSSELKFGHKAFKQKYVSVERRRRCKSAPPSYKRKTSFYCLYQRKEEKHNAAGFYGLDQRKTDKFNATNFYCMDQGKDEKLRASAFLDSPPHLELGQLRDSKHFSGTNNLYINPSPLDDLSMGTRTDMTKMPTITGNNKEKQEGKVSKQFQSDVKVTASALELCSKETQESYLWIKWKNCCPTTRNDGPRAFEDEVSILDISSGFLSLARNSLVPKSIDKNFLEDAKVLLQLDKKFIPVVSGGILAVIDQHAADERIRLEDLRQKLLSGEAKTIAYLEDEHELVLPEIGYQLLYNYSDQVKEWGWICNIHAQDSKCFQRNLNILYKQETVITLMAVPCILGVNLSDADLLEFLDQLADTDGSSTMPPSVLRVLNSKACRGAIMFGDSLLPSECSLIVEELKQTSLCFQCAHGRPTTVPLVNLEALHKQIREMEILDKNGLNGTWHGLRRHELSIERMLQHVGSA